MFSSTNVRPVSDLFSLQGQDGTYCEISGRTSVIPRNK